MTVQVLDTDGIRDFAAQFRAALDQLDRGDFREQEKRTIPL